VAELAGSPELEELAAGLGVTPESLGDALDRPEFGYGCWWSIWTPG